MKSLASQSRRSSVSLAVVGALTAVAVFLSAGPASAQSGEDSKAAEAWRTTLARRVSDPYADRFPNVVLKTHEGRNVRFYDDLLKGKIVLINFMYATCKER